MSLDGLLERDIGSSNLIWLERLSEMPLDRWWASVSAVENAQQLWLLRQQSLQHLQEQRQELQDQEQEHQERQDQQPQTHQQIQACIHLPQELASETSSTQFE